MSEDVEKIGRGDIQMTISYTERFYLGIASLVGLLSLLASVWYAAISVNDMKHSVQQLTVQVQEVSATQKGNTETYNTLQRNQEMMLKDLLTVVYVNSDHILVKTPRGETVKIPMIVEGRG